MANSRENLPQFEPGQLNAPVYKTWGNQASFQLCARLSARLQGVHIDIGPIEDSLGCFLASVERLDLTEIL